MKFWIDDFEITIAEMEWEVDSQLKSGKTAYNLQINNHHQLIV